jgi:hypothetical protein
MELGLEQFFIGQLGLVFSDECWRQGTAQRIFDNLVVFAGTEQHANRRTFVRFPHVTIQGF